MSGLRAMIACAIVALTSATGLTAQEEPAEEPRHHSGRDHEAHRNTVGVFVGFTAGGEEEGGGKEDATGTIGIECERRLTRLLGIGAGHTEPLARLRFMYEFEVVPGNHV
jgi:hypothetical protein